MSLQSKSHHVVVVGAGYAGLSCAMRLGRRLQKSAQSAGQIYGDGSRAHVTLINREARQELICDLFRSLRTGDPETFSFRELAQDSGVRFLEGNVHRIDPLEKKLFVRGERSLEVPYDTLVVATGGKVVQPGIDGLDAFMVPNGLREQRIFPFRNNLQVQALRLALKRLAWGNPSADAPDSFVVVLGAGATGLEVAGELAHLRGRRHSCRVILIDERDELLPEFSPVARRLLKQELHRKKIETILGSPAVRVKDREIHIENGQVIPWDLLVLCSGTRAPSLLKSFGTSFDPRRGLRTNERLEVVGYPQHYAVGDALNYAGSVKRAQFAVQEGNFVADVLGDQILRGESAHRRRFEAEDWGYLVSLGPYSGVGRIGPEIKNPLGRLLSPFLAGPTVDSMKRVAKLKYLAQLKWG